MDDPETPQTLAKGRGRPPGSTKDKGKGKGRPPKKAKTVATGDEVGIQTVSRKSKKQEEMERLNAQIAERDAELWRAVDRLSFEECKAQLFKVGKYQPGFLFDLLKMPDGEGGNEPEPSDTQKPKWCVCGNCREMGTMRENYCCGLGDEECISESVQMLRYCLDEPMVALARGTWRDMHVEPDEDEPGRTNRGMRHAAYRQFVIWKYGRLGAGNRVVIFSCCVLRIRRKFPDPNGRYTGFQD